MCRGYCEIRIFMHFMLGPRDPRLANTRAHNPSPHRPVAGQCAWDTAKIRIFVHFTPGSRDPRYVSALSGQSAFLRHLVTLQTIVLAMRACIGRRGANIRPKKVIVHWTLLVVHVGWPCGASVVVFRAALLGILLIIACTHEMLCCSFE
ncbi:hypothetical protein FB451DRAFT_1549721, partial [Mycena latifolia]